MLRLVALFSCIGVFCARASPLNLAVHNERQAETERVVGGSDARPNVWRWQVSLQYDYYNSNMYFYHICGATIIDPFYAITAAHCIISREPSPYRVVLGEYNLNQDEGSEQFHRVERIIVHPGWTNDLGKGNDIALLRLATPAYDNGYMAFAQLPMPNQMLPHGFQCYITGWGLLATGGSEAVILQEAPISVVEHSVCSTPEWWGSIALKTMVCAGGDGYISGCQGDSGGPLSCYTDGAWRVHGVVSYGPSGNCNQLYKPTVFTRVSSFIGWINSEMN